jgi:hypothetical protein
VCENRSEKERRFTYRRSLIRLVQVGNWFGDLIARWLDMTGCYGKRKGRKQEKKQRIANWIPPCINWIGGRGEAEAAAKEAGSLKRVFIFQSDLRSFLIIFYFYKSWIHFLHLQKINNYRSCVSFGWIKSNWISVSFGLLILNLIYEFRLENSFHYFLFYFWKSRLCLKLLSCEIWLAN